MSNTNKSSILRPPVRREPLQDLQMISTVNSDEDTTSTITLAGLAKRRVSFSGRNSVKEYVPCAEPICVMSTPAYEEIYAHLSSDSSCLGNNSGQADENNMSQTLCNNMHANECAKVRLPLAVLPNRKSQNQNPNVIMSRYSNGVTEQPYLNNVQIRENEEDSLNESDMCMTQPIQFDGLAKEQVASTPSAAVDMSHGTGDMLPSQHAADTSRGDMSFTRAFGVTSTVSQNSSSCMSFTKAFVPNDTHMSAGNGVSQNNSTCMSFTKAYVTNDTNMSAGNASMSFTKAIIATDESKVENKNCTGEVNCSLMIDESINVEMTTTTTTNYTIGGDSDKEMRRLMQEVDMEETADSEKLKSYRLSDVSFLVRGNLVSNKKRKSRAVRRSSIMTTTSNSPIDLSVTSCNRIAQDIDEEEEEEEELEEEEVNEEEEEEGADVEGEDEEVICGGVEEEERQRDDFMEKEKTHTVETDLVETDLEKEGREQGGEEEGSRRELEEQRRGDIDLENEREFEEEVRYRDLEEEEKCREEKEMDEDERHRGGIECEAGIERREKRDLEVEGRCGEVKELEGERICGRERYLEGERRRDDFMEKEKTNRVETDLVDEGKYGVDNVVEQKEYLGDEMNEVEEDEGCDKMETDVEIQGGSANTDLMPGHGEMSIDSHFKSDAVDGMFETLQMDVSVTNLEENNERNEIINGGKEKGYEESRIEETLRLQLSSVSGMVECSVASMTADESRQQKECDEGVVEQQRCKEDAENDISGGEKERSADTASNQSTPPTVVSNAPLNVNSGCEEQSGQLLQGNMRSKRKSDSLDLSREESDVIESPSKMARIETNADAVERVSETATEREQPQCTPQPSHSVAAGGRSGRTPRRSTDRRSSNSHLQDQNASEMDVTLFQANCSLYASSVSSSPSLNSTHVSSFNSGATPVCYELQQVSPLEWRYCFYSNAFVVIVERSAAQDQLKKGRAVVAEDCKDYDSVFANKANRLFGERVAGCQTMAEVLETISDINVFVNNNETLYKDLFRLRKNCRLEVIDGRLKYTAICYKKRIWFSVTMDPEIIWDGVSDDSIAVKSFIGNIKESYIKHLYRCCVMSPNRLKHFTDSLNDYMNKPNQ